MRCALRGGAVGKLSYLRIRQSRARGTSMIRASARDPTMTGDVALHLRARTHAKAHSAEITGRGRSSYKHNRRKEMSEYLKRYEDFHSHMPRQHSLSVSLLLHTKHSRRSNVINA